VSDEALYRIILGLAIVAGACGLAPIVIGVMVLVSR
jgi:hypothetical protein